MKMANLRSKESHHSTFVIRRALKIYLVFRFFGFCNAWVSFTRGHLTRARSRRSVSTASYHPIHRHPKSSVRTKTRTFHEAVPFEDLMEMDVVIFSRTADSNEDKNIEPWQLGAVQENGRVAPLSTWSMEPVFEGFLEFLVDEKDLLPGYTERDIVVHSILPQSALGYGSRQVGGGKGPGNPHGEESERLYYVRQDSIQLLDNHDQKKIEIVVKPELEITW